MPPDPPPAADGLQFEYAEYQERPTVDCVACRVPIGDTYFEINGRVVCPSCHVRVIDGRARGSAAGRVVGALGLGVVAAVAGAVLWYGVREVTHLEIGLIAIGVGLLVGGAVRRGTMGRGGRGYQVLAVVLTYLAIVSANVPYVVRGLRLGIARGIQQAQGVAPESAVGAAPDAAVPDAAVLAKADEAMRHLPVAVWADVGLYLLRSPFTHGFDDALGLLIMFFGLQQAWRLTRAAPFAVAGPFQSSRPGSQA